MKKLKVFDYIQELDAFVINPEFSKVVCKLHLSEWSDVVFIGRYFSMDNDYGEHIFDNWDERYELEDEAAKLGFDSHDLLIIVPQRLQDGRDGPCHSDKLRKLFWQNVFESLYLSLDFLIEEAKEFQVALSSKNKAEAVEIELAILALQQEYEVV